MESSQRKENRGSAPVEKLAKGVPRVFFHCLAWRQWKERGRRVRRDAFAYRKCGSVHAIGRARSRAVSPARLSGEEATPRPGSPCPVAVAEEGLEPAQKALQLVRVGRFEQVQVNAGRR